MVGNTRLDEGGKMDNDAIQRGIELIDKMPYSMGIQAKDLKNVFKAMKPKPEEEVCPNCKIKTKCLSCAHKGRFNFCGCSKCEYEAKEPEGSYAYRVIKGNNELLKMMKEPKEYKGYAHHTERRVCCGNKRK